MLKDRHIRGGWSIGKRCIFAGIFALLCWYACCLPKDLFPDCKWSTVVVDRNGELLGARIAEDGQWRFPAQTYADSDADGVEKYKKSVIEFEDRWFRWHWGVNPVSICRALAANAKAGHIVSGGSTLTMQVVRMSRGKERTVWQKFIEAILATRLEFRYSKDEILELYAAHAPFGGNVVGLEAASWRYFGRPASDLSWGEAATLAVLPNSPSSIRLGKNREKLEAKRNRLLNKLKDRGLIGESECGLACSEPLPEAPEALPSYASQLVDDIASGNWSDDGKAFGVLFSDNETELQRSTGGRSGRNELTRRKSTLKWDKDKSARFSQSQSAGRSKRRRDAVNKRTDNNKYIRTTLDIHLQREVERILDRKNDELAVEGINDLAAVVIDVNSGEALAYVGNANPDRKRLGANVNIARAPRSSGSILKPFLYCDALSDGTILPYSLLADTPVNINGFTPQNYDMTYEGAVPAAEALSRSLNVPSVHLLKMYVVQKFLERLQERGLTTFGRSASDYGLSLILGGGECRLDEVTAAYATMAREYLAACGMIDDNAEALVDYDESLADGRPQGRNGNENVAGELRSAETGSKVKSSSLSKGTDSDRKAKTNDNGGRADREARAIKAPHGSDDDPVALFYTFDALKEVSRPDEIDWHIIRSVRKVAWKTGTSYGYRDAWAVGATPTVAVGVWAGNASGVGAPGLLGARTAGPVMFEIFNILPADGPAWFPALESLDSDVHICAAEVCRASGFLAGPYCEEVDTLDIPAAGLHGKPCPYHRKANGASIFQLPPAMEWFYRQKHPGYGSVTSRNTQSNLFNINVVDNNWARKNSKLIIGDAQGNSKGIAPGNVSSNTNKAGHRTDNGTAADAITNSSTSGNYNSNSNSGNPDFPEMEFIYPENGSRITLPRQLDGTAGELVLNLAHHNRDATVYWHIDQDYIGETRFVHQMRVHPSPGHHSITVVDNFGNTLSIGITVE